MRFERDELDQANLEPGEMADLSRERERLANAQSLQAFAEKSHATLYEDEGSVIERLGKLKREAEGWALMDPELAEVVGRLETLNTEVKDIAHALRRLGQHWEADPDRLAEVEARLMMLRRLETKYRKNDRRADRLPRRPGRAGVPAAIGGGRPVRPGNGAGAALRPAEGSGDGAVEAASEGGEEAGVGNAEAAGRPGHARGPDGSAS